VEKLAKIVVPCEKLFLKLSSSFVPTSLSLEFSKKNVLVFLPTLLLKRKSLNVDA
jgi:hypothetical protein